jgi:hypothetical protein
MKKFRKNEMTEVEEAVTEEKNSGLEEYEIRNLTESTFPVQVFDDNGQIMNISIRVQGRFGQKPPVIASTAITDQLRELQKKKLIKLVKVS